MYIKGRLSLPAFGKSLVLGRPTRDPKEVAQSFLAKPGVQGSGRPLGQASVELGLWPELCLEQISDLSFLDSLFQAQA
jgi:hypothetical protein